jgi:hypothetical protein
MFRPTNFYPSPEKMQRLFCVKTNFVRAAKIAGQRSRCLIAEKSAKELN